MDEDNKIGIVGGSGYLGSHLAMALSTTNRVRIIDIKPPDFLESSPLLSFTRCDVTNAQDCNGALRGLDIVFHKAGLYGNLPSMRSPHLFYQVNVLGTLNVLQACADHKVKRFVFDSTEFVYGRAVSSPVSEQAHAQPSSIYGATKLICEAAVGMYDAVHDLPSIVLRFCRVRDRAKNDVIAVVVDNILKGKTLTLMAGGRPSMDFVEISDVTSACIAAADSTIRHEIFNIGPGEGISLKQIAETIGELLATPIGAVDYRDVDASPATAEFQFGPDDFHMSVSKAKSVLGWRPAIDIRRSIVETIEYRSHHGSSDSSFPSEAKPR